MAKINETSEYKNDNNFNDFDYQQSIDSIEGSVGLYNKGRSMKLWRTRSLGSLVGISRNKNPLLESFPSNQHIDYIEDSFIILTTDDKDTEKIKLKDNYARGSWTTIVNVILVEARNLPDAEDDVSENSLYCKICLGSEVLKSKSVPHTYHPQWREEFKLHLYQDHILRLSLWDKGKSKNFMGSCILDLSKLEKERTHELWQQLDGGYGCIHLSVTMCIVRNSSKTSSCPNTLLEIDKETKELFAWYNLKSDWKLVGQLRVRVIAAKGLTGKPNAYCTLELDNEKVQTHSSRNSAEPEWNKCYIFNIYDMTSALDLRVYDSLSLRTESLGKLSIPLLRIYNGEIRWYALKDRNKRNGAKGNCPRVLLEMSIVWNPIKSALKLFRPKEVKYIKKSPRFDIGLVYNNLEFVRDTFRCLENINEHLKRLFEWENKELSFAGVIVWIIFWYHFKIWTLPLILLIPFAVFWLNRKQQDERSFMSSNINNATEQNTDRYEKSLTGKIQGLQEMTLTITNGIEFIASMVEKIYNLLSFKVPFLSYLTIILLLALSIVMYCIPFNYILMAIGIYKFTRKYMDPERILNNDILDFVSRIPDDELLNDWKELKVPEPNQRTGISSSSMTKKMSMSIEPG